MKVTNEMPKEGQFAVVWCVTSGEIFSATIEVVGLVMRSYNSSDDEWEYEHGYSEEFFNKVKAQYITEV